MNKKTESISTIIETKEEESKRVRDEVGMARQMCAAMGNNDAEFDLLDDILRRYEEGRLAAEQAILEARAVPENKIQR